MISIRTRSWNMVMCYLTRSVTSLHGRLFASKYLNIDHCTCGKNYHYKSLSQPFFKDVLPSQFYRPLTLTFRTLTKKSSPAREEKLRVNDRVPSGYDLIYKAPLDVYVLLAQGISTLSVILLFGGSIYKTVQGNTEIFSITTKIGEMVENNEQLFILGVALLVVSISIRMFTSNYPLRIYQQNGSYISIFSPELPMQTKTLAFKKGDVKQLEPKGILPWKNSKYAIGKKNVILLEDFFRKPADFTTMLGTHNFK